MKALHYIIIPPASMVKAGQQFLGTAETLFVRASPTTLEAVTALKDTTVPSAVANLRAHAAQYTTHPVIVIINTVEFDQGN